MEDIDRERWRGGVDARLDNLELAEGKNDARFEKLVDQLKLTDLVVAKIAGKFGVYATIGAILGGGIVTAVLQLVIKK